MGLHHKQISCNDLRPNADGFLIALSHMHYALFYSGVSLNKIDGELCHINHVKIFVVTC